MSLEGAGGCKLPTPALWSVMSPNPSHSGGGHASNTAPLSRDPEPRQAVRPKEVAGEGQQLMPPWFGYMDSRRPRPVPAHPLGLLDHGLDRALLLVRRVSMLLQKPPYLPAHVGAGGLLLGPVDGDRRAGRLLVTGESEALLQAAVVLAAQLLDRPSAVRGLDLVERALSRVADADEEGVVGLPEVQRPRVRIFRG